MAEILLEDGSGSITLEDDSGVLLLENIGPVTWGHSTAVAEINTRTFAEGWTGTGAIAGSGDAGAG